MNKHWIWAAAALLVAACTKQELEDFDLQDEVTTTIEFTAEEIAGRTAFGEANGTTYPTLWQAGDEVAVWVNKEKSKRAKVTPENGGRNASFSADLVDDESGKYIIHVLSPYTITWQSNGGRFAHVPIPEVQNPTAESCDPKAMLIAAHTPEMTATSLAEAFADPIGLRFRHLTAYGCITLKNLPEKDLKAVVLIAEEPIAGKVDFNFKGEEAALVTRENDAKYAVRINTSSAEQVWFGIYPQDLSGKQLIVGAVMADDTYYAKTITFAEGDGNFEAGHIAKFSIDFAGIEHNNSISLYRENGEVKGVRYSTSKDPEDADRVFSLTRCAAAPWMVDADNTAVTVETGATDNGTDGRNNWRTLSTWLSENTDYTMPIYDFCEAYGEGWYCPNGEELRRLQSEVYWAHTPQIEVMLAYNGGDLFNGFSSADGDETGDRYWTTRERSETNAYWVRFDAVPKDEDDIEDWNLYGAKKTNTYFGRAVKMIRYDDEIYVELPEAGELIDYSEAAKIGISRPYRPIKVNYKKSSPTESWAEADTRLVAYIDGYERQISSQAEYQTITNRYGSYTGGVRYEATGRFYVKKVGDRFWIIDPEGYPLYMRGVCSVNPGTTAAFSARFSSVMEWVVTTHKELTSIGFHSSGAFGSSGGYEAQQSYNALYPSTPFPLAPSFGFLGQFRSKTGKPYPGEVKENIVGLVLEDDWAEFCVEYMRSSTFAPYINDPNTFGFFSDNEINFSSVNSKILERFLTINDPQTRACKFAQDFMVEKGYAGTLEVFQSLHWRVKSDLNSEFAGRLAEKYYSAVRAAKDEVAPGLLYLGSRLHGTPKRSDHVVAAAGRYCDIISINYYSVWSPEADQMQTWGEMAPNTPFFVTEFYTQGHTSPGLEDSDETAEWDGAGWHVANDNDRAYAYQHFTLGLLETKNCVGWHWFKYLDDEDPSSYKGLYDLNYHIFPALSKMAAEVNFNAYNLIDFFDRQAAAQLGSPGSDADDVPSDSWGDF